MPETPVLIRKWGRIRQESYCGTWSASDSRLSSLTDQEAVQIYASYWKHDAKHLPAPEQAAGLSRPPLHLLMSNAGCGSSLRLQDEITVHIYLKYSVRDLQPDILETNTETTGIQIGKQQMTEWDPLEGGRGGSREQSTGSHLWGVCPQPWACHPTFILWIEESFR